ncbi:MAG TPA: tetratricopeptide repeat protein [Thermoanaerobaculia bacterium]|nr:tetratricopeptide repeat protein [Thermoanaerobaculia bacterium]
MRTSRFLGLSSLFAATVFVTGIGCAQKADPAPAASADATTPKPAGDGKVPITTSSAEAKAEYEQGRTLVDNLKITDAAPHFQKAVELDPSFAIAELSVANSSPNGTAFFEHLNKAVALADKASNGEKLTILAAQAGANGDLTGQRNDLEQLVAAYPNDERAHFALGTMDFAQNRYPEAIEQFQKAVALNPNYASAYNLLGYSLRQNVNYPESEKAFQKYVELIPKDPNPYDSYAELLLKMGRFDDAITQYRKALEIDPNFVNAHQGIAMALLYQGKPDQAAAELANIDKKARTDAERRTGLFALYVVHVDSGKLQRALQDAQAQYQLGEKSNDVGAMSFDKGLEGTILLEMGKPDQAKAQYEEGVKLVQASNLSQDIKNNSDLVLHYNLARVAVAKKDFATARQEADEFRAGATASKNPNQLKNSHELDGIIALAEKDYDKAIAELSQANSQNPQDFYRICVAYQGKGDAAKATEYCTKAADFNSLPNQNYAWVRVKAKAGAEGQPAHGK